MSHKQTGIGCFIICFISLFVAYERYQSNANAVAAMNALSGGMFGPLTGQGPLQPATPTITIYAMLFAVLTGAGGIVCFSKARHQDGIQRGRSSTRNMPKEELPNFDNLDV